MGMTMTQKILAAHAGLDSVSAGQLIEADLDLVLGNDITSPVAIHEIDKMKVEGVFNKDKIALVMDHFAPNKDIKSAEHCKCVREFACKNEITNYFDVGKMGIEHALLPEQGLTVAGDVIIGADSHTCTYGALGAFSTGVGSTDMAAGMATGKAWFKVPSAIKFNIVGKPAEWISGKASDVTVSGMSPANAPTVVLPARTAAASGTSSPASASVRVAGASVPTGTVPSGGRVRTSAAPARRRSAAAW